MGRAYVLWRADYYSSTLLEMTVEIVDAPKTTMGVTRGLVLYVNGEWLLNDPEMQTDEAIGSCLVHECEHPLRGIDRLEVLADKQRANVAGDEAINWNLRDEKWFLPSWVVYPEALGHPGALTLEQYYALLQQQQNDQQKTLQDVMNNTQQPGKSGSGSNKEKKGSAQGGKWEPKIGSGACGSIGGAAVDETLEQELDAAYGKSQAEVESARRQTLDAIEAAAASPSRGDMPGRFKEMIKDRYKKPEVNWRKVARHIFQRSMHIVAGASDYSMRNPSVSSQLVGYIGPGLIDTRLEVVVIEDTSASMDKPQLVQARGETYQLMQKLGIDEVTLIQSDTQVAHVQRVRLRNLPHIEYSGRGGTNFIPAFEYVQKKLPRTNLVVVFTDGDGPAPAKAPKGFETVWCIVRTSHARKPAHWGQVVVCDQNQALLPPL
jgi:predicted metal-dependent peptidase